jgi:hypothetical protein
VSAPAPAPAAAPAPAPAPKGTPLWRSSLFGHALFFVGIALCVAYFLLLGPRTSEARVRVDNAIAHFQDAAVDREAAYHELQDAFSSYNGARRWETIMLVGAVALMGAGRLVQALAARKA